MMVLILEAHSVCRAPESKVLKLINVEDRLFVSESGANFHLDAKNKNKSSSDYSIRSH